MRFLLSLIVIASATARADTNATEIVRAAIDHWRGVSSYSEMTMTIHRPDWERSMSMRGWTQGEDRSLVRVTAPARDRGNATLMDDDRMWTYSPRINQVIKVPSSMMNQSWMGSDFSNRDISRADDIVEQYEHSLVSQTELDGHAVYEVQAVPLEDAAVVWGREILRIRDDHVLIEHRFYDQDDVLVKSMVSLEIGEMGGRTVAIRQRMQKADEPEEWTEIQVDAVEYDIDISDRVFTQSNLRNPRER